MFRQASPLGGADVEVYSALPPTEYAALRAWATTFYPYQRDWLFDPSPFGIACKARQIGFSHTSGALALVWSAIHGEMTTIISVGKREAKEVLDKCARHARILQALNSKMADMVSSSKEEIVFASGGRIVALPSEGGRSFTGNVILDEFAYQQHADAVWDAAAPVMTLGDYRLRVISTPNGNGNAFAVQWDEACRKGSDWSVHRVPLSVAVDQGFPVNMSKAWRAAKGDPRLFEQFYNCSFLDAQLQYLSSDRIDACRTRAVLLPDDDGIYYAGLDIGRTNDKTVLVVILWKNGRSKVVHIEEGLRTDSDGLDAMVDAAFARYNLRRLCVDATGMGSFPSDRMKKKHGDSVEVSHRRNRVEAIDFSLKSKEAMATNAYAILTARRVDLPDGDAQLPLFTRKNADGTAVQVNKPGTALELRRELASIQRIVTPSGNVTYDSPRTSKGHGDRAWAFLLALYAIDKVNAMVDALMTRAGLQPSA